MSTPDGRLREGPHRVVVVGGGFGGLQAVRRLRALPVSITLIDRRSFHVFQLLVYQMATWMLSAGEIAAPLRAVFNIGEACVEVTTTSAQDEPAPIPARTVVRSAGVTASDLATALAAESGAEVGRGGRVAVGPDPTLRGHPEVLALGDMAGVHDAQGRPVALPGLAPVAMQQGRYAARLIDDRLHGRRTPPFHYHDKGSLATIGRAKAVADFRWVRPGGLPAWLAWLLVHGFYLIGMQNRLIVMTRWMFSFFTRGGHARLITGSEVSTAARTRELIHS